MKSRCTTISHRRSQRSPRVTVKNLEIPTYRRVLRGAQEVELDYGMSRVEPVVLRASRSRCACAVSESG